MLVKDAGKRRKRGKMRSAPSIDDVLGYEGLKSPEAVDCKGVCAKIISGYEDYTLEDCVTSCEICRAFCSHSLECFKTCMSNWDYMDYSLI